MIGICSITDMRGKGCSDVIDFELLRIITVLDVCPRGYPDMDDFREQPRGLEL